MNNDFFRSKDIFVSAFLLTCQCQLNRLVPEKNFYWFEFEDKERCDELARSFFSGIGKAPARDLFNCFKSLKDMVYAEKTMNNGDNYEIQTNPRQKRFQNR